MVHINELIDFTAEVFVVYGEKVLLRWHDKYNILLSVGGHIDPGEDPTEAAIREVKEEVGLDIELLDTRIFQSTNQVQQLIPPLSINRHSITDTHEHVSLVYVGTSKTDKVIPEKSTDQWRWYSCDEIDALKNIRPDVAFFARFAIEAVRDKKGPSI